MEDFLNSQEFYELMYSYRIAPMTNQDLVVERFERVKQEIRKRIVK